MPSGPPPVAPTRHTTTLADTPYSRRAPLRRRHAAPAGRPPPVAAGITRIL